MRIESLERRQESMQKLWRARWKQGYSSGRRKERVEQEESRSAWEALFGQRADMIGCRLDYQDKARMCHAYDKERTA